MTWMTTVFLHWRVDEASLRATVPAALDLDSFDGDAWLSVVAFEMRGKRMALGIPLAAGVFPELNVRTYVKRSGRPGIRFLSLDTPGRLVGAVGRLMGFPYRRASMSFGAEVVDEVGSHPPLRFTWQAGAPRQSDAASDFLTERYVAFGGKGGGRELHVHHAPWPLRRATASVTSFGFLSPLVGHRQPDLVHASPGVEAAAWYRLRRPDQRRAAPMGR